MWSSMSRVMSRSRSSMYLALDYKRAVLFNVDNVHLDARAMHIHDGKGLLPISRSLGVSSLFKVHEITYLNPMQNTP